MIELKKSTKRGQAMFERGLNNEGTQLSDVYGRYSRAKENAMEWCRNQCIMNDGTDFHICSHNSSFFSVAYRFFINNEAVMRIETASNTYIIWLDR